MGDHRSAHRTQRLDSRCHLFPQHRSASFISCICLTRPHSDRVDKGRRRSMDKDCPNPKRKRGERCHSRRGKQVQGHRLACELQPERQRVGRQLWRWDGVPLQGGRQGWLGMRFRAECLIITSGYCIMSLSVERVMCIDTRGVLLACSVGVHDAGDRSVACSALCLSDI